MVQGCPSSPSMTKSNQQQEVQVNREYIQGGVEFFIENFGYFVVLLCRIVVKKIQLFLLFKSKQKNCQPWLNDILIRACYTSLLFL